MSTANQDLYSPVDESEVPDSPGRAKRYDSLIDDAFANPGQWYRINRTFSSRQTAVNIRKVYADQTDDHGNVVEVRPVEQDGGWIAFVSVQPASSNGEVISDGDDDTLAATSK